MRRIFSLLMCLLMSLSLSVTASAQTISLNIAQPYYEKSKWCNIRAFYKRYNSNMQKQVLVDLGAAKIVGEQYLQKQGFP